MISSSILQHILKEYDINVEPFQIVPFGSGLINHTWKINTSKTSFILQRINTNVFPYPGRIDHNLHLLKIHFEEFHPEYLFAAPTSTIDGRTLLEYDSEIYRVQPFIHGSHTIDNVTSPKQAYEASRQFARFSKLLTAIDPKRLAYPLENFHNLSLRIKQFDEAVKCASEDLIMLATSEIYEVKSHMDIAFKYNQIVTEAIIPLRVIHHDTKISNVLFDKDDKALCVIDLDTVMPGYFISDVGDMMRTYLSEANEEQQDFDQIAVRKDVYDEIYRGYMEEMGSEMSATEKGLFAFSGRFIIYMQAVRFLTDFLNGDLYYPIKYPLQNLKRAGNQLALLKSYITMTTDVI
jgi:Ser/Thr protein kinase RdoA (MazF antagonist)